MTGCRTRTRLCPQPERWRGRWLRAAVFALLSSALAVVGHLLAAGDAVSWPRVAGGTAFAFALSWTVARTSRPWWHVVAATGLAQLVLHRALSDRRSACHGAALGHDGVPQAVRAAHRSMWAMTAAHGAAACLLALLMYRADRALDGLPATVGR
ncbi:hypothetical protein ACFVXK_36940, partial [Streptomyces sp. NPDC058157]